MAQVARSSVDALPSFLFPLSLRNTKPKTFNNIPDELLNNIACHLSPRDLLNLALVESRLYKPSRRFLSWRAYGFTAIMSFADMLLARRRFARSLRTLAMIAAEGEEDTPLLGRAIAIVLEQCPHLRSLGIDGIAPGTTAEHAAVSAVVRLRQLRTLSFDETGTSFGSLQLLSPILLSLQDLNMTFLDYGAGNASSPSFPPCAIKHLDVRFIEQPLHVVQDILPLLACQCRRLDLTIWSADVPSFVDLDTFLPCYMRNDTILSLHILSETPPADWRSLSIPKQAGWLYSTSRRAISDRPSNMVSATHLRIGPWNLFRLVVGGAFAGWLHGESGSTPPEMMWAKRGADWTDKNVAELQSFAGIIGAKLVWM